MAKKDSMEKQDTVKKEMTTEEAIAYRASQYKPQAVVLTELQKREQFRLFWAKQKAQYGKPKELEEILWLHLTASKMNDPTQFEAGLKHFGLKKLSN
jgi:hypothetical protein